MTRNEQLVRDLTELTEFVKAHPDIEFDNDPHFVMYVWRSQPEQVVTEMGKIARACGECKKDYDADHFNLTKHFGKVYMRWFCDRKYLCKKVKVMKEVDEWECPEHPARRRSTWDE